MKPYLIILYLIACVAAGAAADSLDHMNYVELSVAMDLLEKFMLISGAFIFRLELRQWFPYILAMLFFYVVGFDYFYNWIHNLPWDYHGTVKAWDRFLSKYPTSGIVFTRVILLTAGTSITLRYLK
jgi:hypothetical protein